MYPVEDVPLYVKEILLHFLPSAPVFSETTLTWVPDGSLAAIPAVVVAATLTFATAGRTFMAFPELWEALFCVCDVVDVLEEFWLLDSTSEWT